MVIGSNQQLLARQISDLYPSTDSTAPQKVQQVTSNGTTYKVIVPPHKIEDLMSPQSIVARNAK